MITSLMTSVLDVCKESCLIGPILRTRSKPLFSLRSYILTLNHTPSTHQNNKYIITLFDDHTLHAWVKLLNSKDKAIVATGQFLKMVQTQFNMQVLKFMSDGGENINAKLFTECWLIKGLSSYCHHHALCKLMAELNILCALSPRKHMLCVTPWEYQIPGGNLLLNTLLMCTIEHRLGGSGGKFCHSPNLPQHQDHQPNSCTNPANSAAIRTTHHNLRLSIPVTNQQHTSLASSDFTSPSPGIQIYSSFPHLFVALLQYPLLQS
jgi:hypothetical protein